MLTNARLNVLTQVMMTALMTDDTVVDADLENFNERETMKQRARRAWDVAKIVMDAAPEDVKLAISQAEVADGHLEQLLRDMRNAGN